MITMVNKFVNLSPEEKRTAFKKFMGDPLEETKKNLKIISNDPVELGLTLFAIVFISLVMLNSFRAGGASWDGILTEAHGMLMDIFIFGVLLTWFDRVRNKKNEIKNYKDQLRDFLNWGAEEGVLRKVGIIKRLAEIGESSLKLDFIFLQSANLTRVNLTGASLMQADLRRALLCEADLSGANLCYAKLSSANLSKADLFGADLFGANLSRADLSLAENLTCEQIQSAKIDQKTKFLDYIKVTWTDYNTPTCEMVKKEETDK